MVGRWFPVLVAVMAALALVGCRPEAPTASPPAAGPDGTSYESPAGFTLVIPPSWEGHYAVQELSGTAAAAYAPTAQTATRFMYTPADPAMRPAPLLVIYTFDEADWATLSAEPGPPVGTLIASSGGTVFVASTPQSNPYDPGTPDGQTFDQMYADLNLSEDFSITP
jgi:hypothetical protein